MIKENKVVINILLVIIMILVVVACVVVYMCFTNDVEIVEPQLEESIFSEENYPKVETVMEMLPLAEAFQANFTNTDIDDIEIKYSESYSSYENLIKGGTDLILVTYPSQEEVKLVKDNNLDLDIFPIVKDAFVFFVNSENPVDNLTLNQVQNIYSGKIENWKDVGGNDNVIKAFQRPENSASQIGMLQSVMKGVKMIKPVTQTIEQPDVDIVDVIADYDNSENAIGYSYYYNATTMYSANEIKLLSIDGIKPTYENIQTGLYNLQTSYYAVIREDEPEDSNARKLLNAMMSEIGQNVAKEAGYVQNY